MQDICPSTAKNNHIYIRLLHDACIALGGEHKLAEFLGVAVKTVEDWLQGIGHPPDAVFLRCADLVRGAERY
ncbi:MAG TPA: hypothetical protein VGI18_06845 [Burkholderiales bacterium]